jgi:hypothetical protein
MCPTGRRTPAPSMLGTPTPGECVVSDLRPFCWSGCRELGGHGWQHLPTQWCPDDDFDDDESAE